MRAGMDERAESFSSSFGINSSHSKSVQKSSESDGSTSKTLLQVTSSTIVPLGGLKKVSINCSVHLYNSSFRCRHLQSDFL